MRGHLRDDIAHRAATGTFTGDPDAYCATLLGEVAAGATLDRLTETADGRWIHIVHRPMRGGGWVTTHEDVTEGRRAEAAIRASQHVLESTFEHMGQGVSIFDADLGLVATNRRFRELFEMPEPDLMSRILDNLIVG